MIVAPVLGAALVVNVATGPLIGSAAGEASLTFQEKTAATEPLVRSATDKSIVTEAMFWPQLMAEQKLQADHIHTFTGEQLAKLGPVNHVKLNIMPDGGVSRLRVYGRLA